MKSVLIIILVLIALIMLGLMYKRIDAFTFFNRKKQKKLLTVVCENMNFADVLEDGPNVVFQYQLNTIDLAQKDILNGKIDFGLFHRLSVKNLSSQFYKVSIRKKTDSSYFMYEEDLLDQNIFLVTNKKNVHMLKEFGIIE